MVHGPSLFPSLVARCVPSRGVHRVLGGIVYRNDGAEQVRLLEVLECLVGAEDGEPMFIAHLFTRVEDIISRGYTIPEFIHSDGGRRRCLRQEVFYTTSSFLGNASQVHGKFYTVVNYV